MPGGVGAASTVLSEPYWPLARSCSTSEPETGWVGIGDRRAILKLAPLLTARLSDDDHRRILGGNMQRILTQYGLA